MSAPTTSGIAAIALLHENRKRSSALISRDPERAETMVGRFAALLRGSLDDTRHPLISLGSELEMVESYLAIEQNRIGSRLQFNLSVDQRIRTALVPPFSIQCLVENALKHGINALEAGGTIAVLGQREPGCVRIEVRDSGPGFDLSHVRAGHGLDNLIARLETLFGDAGRLEIERSDNTTVVTLVVPSSTS